MIDVPPGDIRTDCCCLRWTDDDRCPYGGCRVEPIQKQSPREQLWTSQTLYSVAWHLIGGDVRQQINRFKAGGVAREVSKNTRNLMRKILLDSNYMKQRLHIRCEAEMP